MIRLTRKLIALFDRKLNYDFVFIIIGSFISGLLELFGIMLILPFVQVAMDPNIVPNSRILTYLYDLSGVSNYTSMIYIVGGLCGISFILKDIYMLLFQYYQFHLVTKWRNELSEKFMKLYLGLNYRFHLRQASTAKINTLTSTISAAVNGYLLQILFMISYSVVALCLISYMLINFWEATVATSFCVVSLILFQVRLLKKFSHNVNKESVVIRERNLSNLKQGIEAIKETKMFMKESFYYDLFKFSNRKVTDNEKRANLVQYIPVYLTEIILIVGIIVLVCTTLYFSESTTNAFAGVAILVAINFRLAPVVNRILTSYSQVKSSTEGVKVLIREHNEIINQQDLYNHYYREDGTKTSEIFSTSISLKSVYFSYNDIMQIFDINLSINKGDFVGFVGASGSGKTTIADILMGLLVPREGMLFLDELPITEDNIDLVRSHIGYVPQSPFISDTSIKENIAYGTAYEDIDEDRILEVLELVGLKRFFLDKQEKLDFKLGENGKQLSGGQKQRVAIARAIYHEPSILVLDEATSALDVKSENEISKAINNLKGKTTVIAIAHRLSTLKNSDKIYMFNEGRLEDEGSFLGLYNRNMKFKELVELSRI